MRIDYFKNFIELAHCGNFSEAAKRLHVSQPVLSKHIFLLEKEFGVSLFERTKPYVELTAEGRILLEEAFLIYEHYQRAKKMLVESSRGGSSALNYGGLYRNADVVELISRSMRKVQEQQIGLTLKRREYPNIPFLEQLDEQHIDLLFSMLNLEAYPLDSSLEAHFLFNNPVLALMQNNHRFAKRESLRLKDFHFETIVLPIGTYALTGRQIIEPKLSGLSHPPSLRPIYFGDINDFNSVILQDDILFIEAPLYETFRFSDNIVAVPVAEEDITFPFYLVHKKDSENKKLAVFVELVLEEASAMVAERMEG